MTQEHRYILGKVDYNNSGRKNCEAVITWKLKDGKFSMCAEIWNPRKTDCYTCGQCVDTVAAYFPNDERVQRMCDIWQLYHLNNAKSGSVAQEAHLAANKEEWESAKAAGVDHYPWAQVCLEHAGLNPDPNYLLEGKPYLYGFALVKHEIPSEIIREIESWAADHDSAADADPFDAWLTKRFEFHAEYRGVDDDDMDTYDCTFKTAEGRGKRLAKRFSWRQGAGHRKDGKGKPWNARRADDHTIMYQFSPTKSAPKPKAVFDALLSDARAYDENRDVADFMENFGYEKLREARRVWQACEKTYIDLQELLGADFSTLLHSEDTPGEG